MTEQPVEPSQQNDSQLTTRSSSNRIDLTVNSDSAIGGDVVGRDKIVSDLYSRDQQHDVRGLANPYLGLQSFTYADYIKYSGREKLIAETVTFLTAQDAPLPLLFVTGASGSGKSSFVQAGVLPALERHYAALSVKWAVFRPSRDPLAALADALWRQLNLPQFDVYTASSTSFGDFLATRTPMQQVNVIVIDQFEELFTQSNAQPRDTLFNVLAHLRLFRSTRTHIIATMRADYLPELFALPELYDIAKRGIDLRAMSVEELREAIQQPLRATYPDKDKHFQPELVDRLAKDAAEDAAYLPLLQVTLEEIWRKGTLTLGVYTNLADAIRQRADKVLEYQDYDAAQPNQPRPPEEQAAILNLCLDLVDVSLDDETRRDVRRPRSKDELISGVPERARLIDMLAQARLLYVDVDYDAPSHVVVDLIHETLLSNWASLRQAIAERRRMLHQRVRFEQQLKEWIEQDRSDDYLLIGMRLVEAHELELRNDISLHGSEAKDFVRRSVELEEARRQKNLDEARRLTEAASMAQPKQDTTTTQTADFLLKSLRENAPVTGLRAALSPATQRQRAEQRAQIAASLGDLRASRAVDALSAQLRDPESAPRHAAASALAQIGTPRAIEALRVATQDANVQAQQAAEKALARLAPSETSIQSASVSRQWASTDYSLTRLPPDLDQAVWASSIPHAFDAQILAALEPKLMGRVGQLYLDLQKLSFIEAAPDGQYCVHAPIRQEMLQQLWQMRSEDYRTYSTRAARYYSQMLFTKSGGRDRSWRNIMGSLLYRYPLPTSNDSNMQIEWLYHLALADPESAVTAIRFLEEKWRDEQRYADVERLLFTVAEHIDAGRASIHFRAVVYYLQGRAELRARRVREALSHLELARRDAGNDRTLLQSVLSEVSQAVSSLNQNDLLTSSREGVTADRVLIEHTNGAQTADRRMDVLKQYQELLQSYRVAHNLSGEAHTASAIGDEYLQRHQHTEALLWYQTALQLYRRIGSHIDEANSLKAIGDLYQLQQRGAEALTCYDEALVQYRSLRAQLSEANALKAKGDALKLLSNTVAALDQYDEALTIYYAEGALHSTATTLIAIGDVLVAGGRHAAALVRYDEALRIYRGQGDESGEAKLHLTIGDWNRTQERFSEALEEFQMALNLYRSNRDRFGEAHALKALGDAYHAQHRAEEAVKSYAQALELYRLLKASIYEAQTLAALGSEYRQQNEHDHAMRAFEAAISVYRTIDQKLGEAEMQLALGEELQLQDRAAEAAQYYTDAALHYRELGYLLGEAHVLRAQGNAAAARNDANEALSYYQMALNLYLQSGDQTNKSDIRARIDDLLGARNQNIAANRGATAEQRGTIIPEAMPQTKSITWLHLADLHFRRSHEYDRDLELNTLLRDISERVQTDGLKPDFVAITGDISYAGRASEYRIAQKFLDDLLAVVNLDKQHLFIVPGNHDVDRSAITSSAHALVSELSDHDSFNSLLSNDHSRNLILKGLRNYNEFIEQYLAYPGVIDDLFYVQIVQIGEVRVAIIGLNSAWSCVNDQIHSRTFLGERQVLVALDKARDADLRIALIHHPLEWLQEFEQTTVARLLSECHFVLHSHAHDGSAIMTVSSKGSRVSVIYSGGSEVRSQHISYNIVQFDPVKGSGTCYLRRYSDRDAWMEDRTVELESFVIRQPQPIGHDEALMRIELAMGNLFEQHVDAIMHPTSQSIDFGGEIGDQLREWLGDDLLAEIRSRAPLMQNEAIISLAGTLPARYVVHTSIDGGSTPYVTLDSVRRGFDVALEQVDKAQDIHTLASPSFGTGAAQFDPKEIAEPILESAVAHLEHGSQINRIAFIFTDWAAYRAYVDVYRSLGGRTKTMWSPRLSVSSRTALLYAEALKQQLGDTRISTRHVLWGLYQKSDGPTRSLLEGLYETNQIETAFATLFEQPISLMAIKPVDGYVFDRLDFDDGVEGALLEADRLARNTVIRSRHLLAGLLSMPENESARFLSRLLGLPANELYAIVAVHDDDEYATPLNMRLKGTLAARAATYTILYLKLTSDYVGPLHVGQTFDLTLHVSAEPQLNCVPLHVPSNSLELTIFADVPGMKLASSHRRTYPIVHGRPQQSERVRFSLTAVTAGKHNLTVKVYTGRNETTVEHVALPYRIEVSTPRETLPGDVLLDRWTMPDPQPDVTLYVLLEETAEREQMRFVITCPTLNYHHQVLEAIPFNAVDLEALRNGAVRAALEASIAAPNDALTVMEAYGKLLFNRVVNQRVDYQAQGLTLGAVFAEIGQKSSQQLWTLLIISDAAAVLPWELMLTHGLHNGRPWQDKFWASRFSISHWIARQGLDLANEAPFDQIDFAHYGRYSGELSRWQAALGEGRVTINPTGQLLLTMPYTPFYGLHVLRYTGDRRRGAITESQQDAMGEVEAREIVMRQQLEFRLRRPVIGVSMVDERSINGEGRRAEAETQLEADWLLPFIRSGATAVIGPRWPVSLEADRLFYRTFYRLMRSGQRLGQAVFRAREYVRHALPGRIDWLSYAYFGHPWCEPYQVEPARGYALFELIDHAADADLLPDTLYRFRASYRAEAPDWYRGRLRSFASANHLGEIEVICAPITGEAAQIKRLERLGNGEDAAATFDIRTPSTEMTLPIVVRFFNDEREFQTFFFNYTVRAEQGY